MNRFPKYFLPILALLALVGVTVFATAEPAHAQGQIQRLTVIENIGNNPGGTYEVPAGKTVTITHLGTNDPNSTDDTLLVILYAGGGGALLDTVTNPGMIQLPTPRVFQAGDHVYVLGGGPSNYDGVAKGTQQ